MERGLLRGAAKALLQKKWKKNWYRVVGALGCVVIFCTIYALILPAITLSNEVICGQEEHIHTRQCYTMESVPGVMQCVCTPESEGIHVHSDECYDVYHVLRCGYSSDIAHEHTGICYGADGTLVCTWKERKVHTHTEACYELKQVANCEQEDDGHVHGEECYITEPVLVCTDPEIILHTHTEECFEEDLLVCTTLEIREHIHREDCFAAMERETLTCGLQEHTHTEGCYSQEHVEDTLETEETAANIQGDSGECYVDAGSTTVLDAQEMGNPTDVIGTNEEDTAGEVITETVISSGTSGEVAWKLTDENGAYTLTLSGSGATQDFQRSSTTAWRATGFRSKITKVVVEDGVTQIGDYAFYSCSALTEVILADSVTEIGSSVFQSCTNLTSVSLGTGVQRMGNYAFAGCTSLPEVSIPDSVTGIADYAFQNCTSLVSVTMGDGVQSVGVSAFDGDAALTDIRIPGSVASIGNYAFQNCSALAEITLESGIKSIGGYTFSGCVALSEVVFPDSLVSIGGNAFQRCTGLAKVSFGSGLQNIGSYAFQRCSALEEVFIPDSVTSLGQYAFQNCTGLTAVTVGDGVQTIPNYAFANNSLLKSVVLGSGTATVDGYAFQNCTSLVSVDFSQGWINITGTAFASVPELSDLSGDYYADQYGVLYRVLGDYAFPAYIDDESYSVPDTLEVVNEDGTVTEYPVQNAIYIDGGTSGNITWIVTGASGEYTLQLQGAGAMLNYSYAGNVPWNSYCTGITEVIMDEEITSVGNYAFYGCSSLETVKIPDSVTRLGDYSFLGCSALAAVTIPENVTYLGNHTFDGCSALTDVKVLGNVSGGGNYTFQNCTSLKSVEVIGNVTGVGNGTFQNCSALMEIQLPDSVMVIGSNAFQNCTSLTNVVLGEGVMQIGDYAFSECSQLQEIVIPGNAAQIGEGIFENCTSLKSVTFGEGVSVIGPTAFVGCTALTELSIPASVTEMEGALAGCTGLVSVEVAADNQTYCSVDGVVYSKDMKTLVHFPAGKATSYAIPDGVTTIGMGAFGGNVMLQEIMIPESVTSLEYAAFAYCTALKSVTVPKSVQTIGDYAFAYCMELTDLTISDGVVTIGEAAFGACSALTRLAIPQSVETIGAQAFAECDALTDVTCAEGYITIGQDAFTSIDVLTDVEGYCYVDGNNALYCIKDGYAFLIYSPNDEVLEQLPADASGTGYPVLPGVCYRNGVSGNVTWFITFEKSSADYTLYLFGDGDMMDYSNYGYVPWNGSNSLITRVVIGENITSIGNYAFYNCAKLTSVDIPDAIAKIGSNAFYGCSGITSITIPSGVTEIPQYAFCNCSALTTVSLPEDITSIGSYAFAYCSKLTEVDFPEGAVTVDANAFYGCANTQLSALTGTCYADEFGVVFVLKEGYAYQTYTPAELEAYVTPEQITVQGIDYPVFANSHIASGTSGNIKWIVTGSSTERILYLLGSGAMNDYSSASSVPWYSYRSSIVEVVIDENITTIGAYAFAYFSKLVEIDIPQNVNAIGKSAFYDCSKLLKVSIPENVTAINDKAFYSCENLQTVALNENILSIGNSAFYGCTSLNAVTLPQTLMSIGNSAFENCSALLSVKIPDSVTTLGNSAFRGCSSLRTASISESLEQIGTSVFQKCAQLISIRIPDRVTAIGSSAFRDCTNLETVLSGIHVQTIDKEAFYGCTKLRSITLTERLTSIGNDAFTSCTALTKVTLPDSVTSLGTHVFKNCTGLSEVKLGKGISVLGTQAFYGCTGLENVRFSEGHISLESSVFTSAANESLSGLSSGNYCVDANGILYSLLDEAAYAVYVPTDLDEYELPPELTWNGTSYLVMEGAYTESGKIGKVRWVVTTVAENQNHLYMIGSGAVDNFTTTSLPPWAAKYSNTIVKAVVREGITQIGAYSFADHTALTEVAIPESVAIIGARAFSGCTELSAVSLGSGVKVNSYAFANCVGLTELVIPDSTTLARLAFANCTGLTRLEIGSDVTVGANAFSGCTGLETVSLGERTSTAGNAFKDCTSLVSVTAGNDCVIGSSAFKTCTNLKTAEFGDNITINSYAFDGVESLTSVTFGDVAYAGSYVFRGCTGITQVVMGPDSYIDQGAFADCTGIETVTMGDRGYIEGNAFSNCTALKTLNLGEQCEIGNQVFDGADSLKSLTIGAGSSIGSSAFRGCTELQELIIPDDVSISGLAFQGCTGLTTVQIGDRVTILARAFEACTGITSLSIGNGAVVNINTFGNCTGLTTVTIGDDFSTKGTGVFSNCTSLKSVTLGDNAVLTGVVFGANTPLTEIKLGTAPTLASAVFSDCTELSRITFAQGYQNIPAALFEDCSKLGLLNQAPAGSYYADVDGTLYLAVSGVGYYVYSPTEEATVQSTILTEANDGHTYPVYCAELPAFLGTKQSVIWMLYGESDAYTLVVTGACEIPNYYATSAPWHDYCDQITKIEIGSEITGIGNYAFVGCINAETVEIGAAVQTIGDYAFQNCESLSVITIPAAVTDINETAFLGCTGIREYAVMPGNTAYMMDTLSLYTADGRTLVFFPAVRQYADSILPGTTTIGAYAFANNDNLVDVILPEGLENIAANAFSDCDNLKKIVMPKSISFIGNSAFADCDSLTEITFQECYVWFEPNAFAQCALATPMNKAGAGTFYVDPVGALYLITDGNAMYIGCPEEQADYVILTQTPRINGVGPYLVQTNMNVVDYGVAGELSWHIIENSGAYVLVISGEGDMPDYSGSNQPWGAYRNQIQEVVIREGVTGIGNYAFYDCPSLISADIPDSVTGIGQYAFNNSSIEYVEIPNGVSEIGKYAFFSCDNLTRITIPDNATVDTSAFANCTNLADVSLGVDCSIGDRAFSGCGNITNTSLHQGYFELGTATFQSGLLDGFLNGRYYVDENGVVYRRTGNTAYVVSCPEGVTEIKSHLPSEDGIVLEAYEVVQNVASGTSGNIDWVITVVDGEYTLSLTGEGAMTNYYSTSSVPWYAYSGIIDHVQMGEGITSIGNYAFDGFANLTSMDIPESVTSVGSYAFRNSGLTVVDIPTGVTSIGSYAFQNCTAMDSAVLSETVTSIGAYAFYGCSQLASVNLPAGITSIASYTFNNCSSLTEVVIPEGVTSIGTRAFSGCTKLAAVTLPGTVTTIESSAFNRCQSLTSIEIPESVTRIENGVFAYCSALESVVIHDSVTYLGNYAFDNCSELKALTIGRNVEIIGDYAFRSCGMLDTVHIPGSVQTVGISAFADCSALTSLQISEGVTSIGASAFIRCSSLKEVTIPSTTETIGNSAFQACGNLETVNILDGVTRIGNYAFYQCAKLSELTLPNTLITIGNSAIRGGSIQSVEIPDSVTTIDEYAFYQNSLLEEVTIGESITNLTYRSLALNGKLKTVVLNARELTAADAKAFEFNTGIKTVVVGTGVDVLHNALFDVISTNPLITFKGPNYVTIDASFTHMSQFGKMADQLEAGETYYVDAQGVMYHIVQTGNSTEAHLIYVPAGIEKWTVPSAIDSEQLREDGSVITYPVTTIAQNGLANAEDLTALSFENLEVVTTLEDWALANCQTLTSITAEVDGQTVAATTVSEATSLFSGKKVGMLAFFNTGLKSDSVDVNDERIEIATSTGVSAIITTRADEDYTLYTGESAVTTIALSNSGKQSEDMALRVYFGFSDSDGTFGMELGDQTIASECDGKQYTFTVHFGRVDGTSIYYVDLPAIASGDTIIMEVSLLYKSPTTDGGKVLIWCDSLISEDDHTWSDLKTFHEVNWITAPDVFAVKKSQTSDPRLYGNGTEDGAIAVQGLSYTITHRLSSRVAPATLGKDHVKQVDFKDTLLPGDNLKWNQDVLDAIKNGNWSARKYQDTSTGKTVNGYELYCEVSDQIIPVCRINSVATLNWKLSVGEDDRSLVVGWSYENTKFTSAEISNLTFILMISNNIIQVDMEEIKPGDTFTLVNRIQAVDHFSYSDDQTIYGEDVETTITAQKAKAEMEKYFESDKAVMGEYYPYFVDVANYGAVSLVGVDRLQDSLDPDLYIASEDLATMFRSDFGRENLVVTIQGATLYNSLDLVDVNGNVTPRPTVTGTDGEEHTLTIENTSVYTVYHDKESDEEDGCIKQAGVDLTIGWQGDQLVLSGDSIEPLVIQNYDIKAAFDSIGFFVTPAAKYTVTWDYNSEGVIFSGEERQYVIRSTLKDTFMALSWDYDGCILAVAGKSVVKDSFTLSMNNAELYYLSGENTDEKTDNDEVTVTESEDGTDPTATDTKEDAGFLKANSTSDKATIQWDFKLQDQIYLNGRKVDGHTYIKAGSVLDYVMHVEHRGDKTYEIVPMVQKMEGVEVLMVTASLNRHLGEAPYNLIPTNIGGVDYYLLDKPNVYENVMIGGCLADRIQVTKLGTNRLHSLVYWYLTDICGQPASDSDRQVIEVSFKVLVGPLDPIDTEITFRIGNEVWINDHQTHRLRAATGLYTSFLTFEKDIVTRRDPDDPQADVLDADRDDIITEGETVVYRLQLDGAIIGLAEYPDRTIVLPGSQISDILPLGIPRESCPKIAVEYVHDGNVSITNPDSWEIVQNSDQEDQYSIVWGEDFKITYHATSSVYIYVTVTYPSGADWKTYSESYGSNVLKNTLQLSGDSKEVTHTLQLKALAKLVKGVNSTGVYVEVKDTATDLYNDLYYPSEEYNSRWNFVNKDGSNRVVTYYVSLYNEGNTRLYVQDIYDILPPGFTLCDGDGRPVFYQEEGAALATVDDHYGLNVTYVKADVSVTETDGMLVFCVTDGVEKGVYSEETENLIHYDKALDKYYLLPNEALLFSYRCYTNEVDASLESSENKIAMPYFDYNGGGVTGGLSKVHGTSAFATACNDGLGYDTQGVVLDEVTANSYGFTAEQAKQWLYSEVTVSRGGIIPGIRKSVHKVENTTAGIVNTSGQAKLEDTITWKVSVTNEGTTPMRDYIITDVMQHDYNFTGMVSYQITDSEYFGDYKNILKGDLFNIEDIPKNGEVVSIESTKFGRMEVSYMPYDTENNPNNAVLAIRFLDDVAAIPEGGSAELYVSTVNDGNWKNTVYVNTSYITPSETNWNGIGEGEPIIYNDKNSVKTSAQIVVSANYITTSVKRVQELNVEKTNSASSDASPNYIVLSDADSVFRYTLQVSNTGGTTTTDMQQLVIIDTLPHVGDHNVLVEDDLRHSDFKVSLTDSPDFEVVLLKDKKETVLTSDQYRLEFTAETQMEDLDWEGQNTNEKWGTQCSDQTQSFRIILQNVPAETTVLIRFNARVQGIARPGQIAWNSFAYSYKVNLNGIDVELKAGPGKVGVQIPSVPSLVKQLQTPSGAAYQAEKNEHFAYLICKGTNTGLDGLTEIQILEKLGDTPFTVVESVTVLQGSSTSETIVLDDLYEYVANGTGSWCASTNQWKWKDGQDYTVYELPISNSQDYAFAMLGGRYENGFTFTYNASANRTIVSVNRRLLWNLEILKASDDEQQAMLENAWFGLYGPEATDLAVEVPEGLTAEVPMTRSDADGNVYYLISIQRTDTNGLIQWKDLTCPKYLIYELQAPPGYHTNDVVYVADRSERNQRDTLSLPIQNSADYRLPDSGGAGETSYVPLGAAIMLSAGVVCILEEKRRKKTFAGTDQK